jgi:hypothetical protein
MTIVINIEAGQFNGTPEQADEFLRAVREAVRLGIPRKAVEVVVNGEHHTTVRDIARAAADLRATADLLAASIPIAEMVAIDAKWRAWVAEVCKQDDDATGETATGAADLSALAEAAGRLAVAIDQRAMPTADEIVKHALGEGSKG